MATNLRCCLNLYHYCVFSFFSSSLFTHHAVDTHSNNKFLDLLLCFWGTFCGDACMCHTNFTVKKFTTIRTKSVMLWDMNFATCFIYSFCNYILCLWVPVTMAWHVLRLWMEEWPPIWRVAANKLNKQSRTADKGWSSSLRVLGEELTTPPREKQNVKKYSQTGACEYGNELSGSIKCGEFLD